MDIKSKIGILLFFILFSCNPGHKVTTRTDFYKIDAGTTVTELVKTLGTPDYIKELKGGIKEYIYSEKIMGGTHMIESRYYIFIIENDKVIGKKVRYKDRASKIFKRPRYND